MNAKRFRTNVFGVIVFYFLALMLGIWLSRVAAPSSENPFTAYSVWKDSQPLLLPFPPPGWVTVSKGVRRIS
jgi:hypothetical protein